MLRPRPCCVTSRFVLRGPVSRSVRERGLVGSGFFGEGFLGEVTQDSFVEGGEGVEFGGGEQAENSPRSHPQQRHLVTEHVGPIGPSA
jgi:hypothetical protein